MKSNKLSGQEVMGRKVADSSGTSGSQWLRFWLAACGGERIIGNAHGHESNLRRMSSDSFAHKKGEIVDLSQTLTPKPCQINAALMIARLASALTFLYHGSAILFGAFGGPGPVGFAAHMHMSAIVGYLVGLAQFGGGLAMLTGIFARIGAAGIIVVMAGAIYIAHLPHGFDLANHGYEYALTELLIAVAIFIPGPGKYSLATWLPTSLQKL